MELTIYISNEHLEMFLPQPYFQESRTASVLNLGDTLCNCSEKNLTAPKEPRFCFLPIRRAFAMRRNRRL